MSDIFSIKEIMKDNAELWRGFEYFESTRGFDDYEGALGPVTLKHSIYSYRGLDKDALLVEMLKTLRNMAYVAKARKPEACDVGDGRLIVHERLPITYSQYYDDGDNHRIMWYGSIVRI